MQSGFEKAGLLRAFATAVTSRHRLLRADIFIDVAPISGEKLPSVWHTAENQKTISLE